MRKFTKVIATFVAVIMAIGLVACGDKKPANVSDIESPIITLSSIVPVTGVLGREVTLPTAKAQDNKDGDISSKVKVTVEKLNDDSTVEEELLFKADATKVQKFTPVTGFTKYRITYMVKDIAGNEGVKKSDFTGIPDITAPVLTLIADSIPGFDLTTGVTGKEAENIVLPKATAIDDPGSIDLTKNINIEFYLKDDTAANKRGTKVSRKYTNTTELINARLVKGEYIAVYSVKDSANNPSNEIIFPISVSAMDTTANLVLDQANFVYDSRPEFVEVNEFNEIMLGQMGDVTIDQPICLAMSAKKIHSEIVGISFNADPAPANGGQDLYDFSARGSKNNSLGEYPNNATGEWPVNLVLRIQKTGTITCMAVSTGAGLAMTQEIAYNEILTDGKDHIMYLQWLNVGENATAVGAKIVLQGWIDTTPDNAPSIKYSVMSGENDALGIIKAEKFAELWSNEGAGWFNMQTATFSKNSSGKFENDHMRIKGLTVYDQNATAFENDIQAPTFTTVGDVKAIYATDELLTLPTTSEIIDSNAIGENSLVLARKYKIGNGDYVNIDKAATTLALTTAGNYRLAYTATDAAGNVGYKVFDFIAGVRDTVAPVITVDTTTINAVVGKEFIIPAATANDDQLGDLTSYVNVKYNGKQFEEDITRGGATGFTPMIAGEHKIVYTARDNFNVSTKEVIVNVTGGHTGNVITAIEEESGAGIQIPNGTNWTYDKEYIYDQKVSMIVNVKADGLLQINLRGDVGSNKDWPSGMVIRSASGNFEISAYKHDMLTFATTPNPFATEWRRNVDAKLDFKVSNVTVGGVDYIKVQMWYQDEELIWTPKPDKGGEIGIEAGSNAIYRKISAFNSTDKNNIFAGFLHLSSVNSSDLTIKEMRIDGTECTKPADAVKPGPKVPTFGVDPTVAPTFAGDTAVEIANGQTSAQILPYINDGAYVTMKLAQGVVGEGAKFTCIRLAGSGDITSVWSTGLWLRLSDGQISLYSNGINTGDPLAFIGGSPFHSSDTPIWLRIKVDYNKNATDATNLDSMTFTVWTSVDGTTFTKQQWGEESAKTDTAVIDQTLLTQGLITQAPMIIYSHNNCKTSISNVTWSKNI